ncbi:MAG: tRNA pseudouridine(38-40) synthase TruA [Clostridia bacterium]|nr:tRNA pseudouridine(38-40) synthase TruA [Clostridia bacterium]
MKNYKISIQYDGTKYNGWQRQKNTKNTIQEKFESVLSKMCTHNVEIFASGRTDAGVHAEAQVANFKCNTNKTPEEIKEYLNHYLPRDILVTSIKEVPERFHSRLNAVSKTYEYTIATKKPDVFTRKYVYFVEDGCPDVEKMKEVSQVFLGTHDFLGFSSVGKTKKSTVRTINFIDIEESDGLIKIKINADGFLYNMVRIIAGTIFDAAKGKISANDIINIFSAKIRAGAGVTLPACGLKLIEVFYKEQV